MDSTLGQRHPAGEETGSSESRHQVMRHAPTLVVSGVFVSDRHESAASKLVEMLRLQQTMIWIIRIWGPRK